MSLNSLAESDVPSQLAGVIHEAHGIPQGERYLSCYLEPSMTVLLPVQHLTEVLTVSLHQVTPIPMMEPWVMGVHNWRGEVLWMVDLGHLLGLTPWYEQSRHLSHHNALVIRNHDGDAKGSESELKLGLVVSQVQDIEVIPSEQMRPPSPNISSPELAPYFKGYSLAEQGDLQGCLDPDAIFSMIAK